MVSNPLTHSEAGDWSVTRTVATTTALHVFFGTVDWISAVNAAKGSAVMEFFGRGIPGQPSSVKEGINNYAGGALFALLSRTAPLIIEQIATMLSEARAGLTPAALGTIAID